MEPLFGSGLALKELLKDSLRQVCPRQLKLPTRLWPCGAPARLADVSRKVLVLQARVRLGKKTQRLKAQAQDEEEEEAQQTKHTQTQSDVHTMQYTVKAFEILLKEPVKG